MTILFTNLSIIQWLSGVKTCFIVRWGWERFLLKACSEGGAFGARRL